MNDVHPRSETGCRWCGCSPCEPHCLGSVTVDPPIARETSRRCLRAIQESGLVGKAQLQVYELLVDQGPLTGREVDELVAGVTGRGHSHKRLSELERLGLVRALDPRPCKVTGRAAVAWEALDREPQEPPARRTLRQGVEAAATSFAAEPDRSWTGREVADALWRLLP